MSAAFYHAVQVLQSSYDEREAAAIAHELMEYSTGLGKLDRLMHKERSLTPHEENLYNTTLQKLANGVPLQYAIGKAWFMGHPYIVDDRVLIPRPETEELIDWATTTLSTISQPYIFEVGTGSGCISIELKTAIPAAHVTACDISEGALQVAHQNANALGAEIHFLQLDFLNERHTLPHQQFDLLISNPPYIPISDAASMAPHVLNHEPHLALFVPDADPLVFYRAIAQAGLQVLRNGAYVFCELDANHAQATASLFRGYNYHHVEIRNDINGHPRMLKAQLIQ